MTVDTLLQQAAHAIATADALLIGAGAGMGVDSGLPDFRGNVGFWQAYPVYAQLGYNFKALANPNWFNTNPTLAWGFYGHRLNLYRNTVPHAGFQLLLNWSQKLPGGVFVYTSNVDGQFQRAGFDPSRIQEVHGSIHWLQCLHHCGIGLFPADQFTVNVDEATMRAQEPLPSCPACGGLARPNILMFGDAGWDCTAAYDQEVRLNRWLQSIKKARLVIIECGAGLAIPSVRYLCEYATQTHQACLIRINTREAMVPEGQLGLSMGALEGLQAIQDRL